jgi:hypothetical protein
MNQRRRVLLGLASAGTFAVFGSRNFLRAKNSSPVDFKSQRPDPSQRKFVSDAVEAKIVEVKRVIADPELAWLFENCFSNTLDTTVTFGSRENRPDTVVVTGDINAMWLRDSTAQITPYVRLHDTTRS